MPLRQTILVSLLAGVVAVPAVARNTSHSTESQKGSVGKQATVAIKPLDGFKEGGSAVLTALGNNRTRVHLRARNEAWWANQPAYIYGGTCVQPNLTKKWKLHTVTRGKSTTTVQLGLNKLLSGDYIILIHKSNDDLGTHVACGEIGGASTATTGR